MCHSTSIKCHQLKLSLSSITTSIFDKISERFCLIDVCVKNFRSNDSTYPSTLKIGTNNVVIFDILNERFLKLHSHLLEKFVFIA